MERQRINQGLLKQVRRQQVIDALLSEAHDVLEEEEVSRRNEEWNRLSKAEQLKIQQWGEPGIDFPWTRKLMTREEPEPRKRPERRRRIQRA